MNPQIIPFDKPLFESSAGKPWGGLRLDGSARTPLENRSIREITQQIAPPFHSMAIDLNERGSAAGEAGGNPFVRCGIDGESSSIRSCYEFVPDGNDGVVFTAIVNISVPSAIKSWPDGNVFSIKAVCQGTGCNVGVIAEDGQVNEIVPEGTVGEYFPITGMNALKLKNPGENMPIPLVINVNSGGSVKIYEIEYTYVSFV